MINTFFSPFDTSCFMARISNVIKNEALLLIIGTNTPLTFEFISWICIGCGKSLPHYGSRCFKSQTGWDQRPARERATGSLTRCFSSFSLLSTDWNIYRIMHEPFKGASFLRPHWHLFCVRGHHGGQSGTESLTRRALDLHEWWQHWEGVWRENKKSRCMQRWECRSAHAHHGQRQCFFPPFECIQDNACAIHNMCAGLRPESQEAWW